MTDRKIVLVTGASQGIGAATARAFADAGHAVVLAARDAGKLDAVAAEIAASGGAALPVACDVTDPGSVEALFERIRAEFTAGSTWSSTMPATNIPAALSGDVSWEGWRKVLSVNLDGAFLIAAAAFRMMRAQTPQGGRIINNGSISAHAPRYGSLPYTASKHAITGITKSISLDGRAFDIACGQIDIGNAASSMTARMAGGVPQADGHLAPEPTIDVEHVAKAVLQMAELPLDVNVQFMTIMATKMPLRRPRLKPDDAYAVHMHDLRSGHRGQQRVAGEMRGEVARPPDRPWRRGSSRWPSPGAATGRRWAS